MEKQAKAWTIKKGKVNKKKQVINLSDKELKVYETILDLKEGTVFDISQKSRLKRTTIYNFIDKLVANGLVGKKVINRHAVYFALGKNDITNIDNKNINNFGLLTHWPSIKQAIWESLNYKEVYWMTAAKSSVDIWGGRFFEKYVEEAKRRKVKLPVLRSPTSSTSKRKYKYQDTEAIKKLGRTIRLAQSTIPYEGNMIVFGQTVIMLSADNNGVAYKLEDETLSDMFISIFKGLWKYSKVVNE